MGQVGLSWVGTLGTQREAPWCGQFPLGLSGPCPTPFPTFLLSSAVSSEFSAPDQAEGSREPCQEHDLAGRTEDCLQQTQMRSRGGFLCLSSPCYLGPYCHASPARGDGKGRGHLGGRSTAKVSNEGNPKAPRPGQA